ncbi:uncharacterized protein LOC106758285 [Vigna radiata var. radiata]|uniref:Uncharacterized protein LOC106758285 n=1 Tax=Vigna radiata var. radiata TaxID=3916 RepID=A0A1S3TSG0_VIGRR|nr:uncharacterized protein LOC106758285 [Vigna radiata var. radiata]
MWVENGPLESTHKIAAGWHVDPALYGDTKTHFYAAWTSDNFKKTGCYNVQCRGFVQIDKKNFLGGYFPNVGTYGGPTYEVLISITQIEFGDIVDCFDIYKQPAFNHPLLINHTLQLKPNFENLIEKTSVNNSEIGSMFGLYREKCPEGTVPIQRVKYDFTKGNLLLNSHTLVKDIPGVHIAELFIPKNYAPLYEVSGINSVYNPMVGKGESSISHIWVENGPLESTNKIAAGWHVDPALYGDTKTHFFAAWTSDNFKKTGCYNVRCRGFVQVNKEIFLGDGFSNISTYGGPTYEVLISIIQDPKTKNWWISAANINIGYYPAALFSNLGSGSIVGWGGRTQAKVGSLSPPMGTGHFPNGIKDHACYFRSPMVQDASREFYIPKSIMTRTFSDNSDCYGVYYYKDFGKLYKEGLIQFGGPGGKCGS